MAADVVVIFRTFHTVAAVIDLTLGGPRRRHGRRQSQEEEENNGPGLHRKVEQLGGALVQ